jgi:hypothetical protein
VFSLLASVLLLPACSPKPDEEIATARNAVEAARMAEADLYAPDAYEAASQALRSAEAHLANRDYTKARALLVRARTQANLATTTAYANKARVRSEAQTARIGAQASLDTAREALRQVIMGNRNGRVLDSLQGELTDAETSFRDAKASYADGKYMDSRNQFNAVRQKAAAIAADIKRGTKPPRRPLRPLSTTAIR